MYVKKDIYKIFIGELDPIPSFSLKMNDFYIRLLRIWITYKELIIGLK